ncbi:hypothetical protein LX32DRAFT_200511 [Colletotrichum zoysiae]|uniref:Uncharacterized protein n=1 Tax=Colletotrichum zoysiae TaxID=1216348 RepID=A0AAD9H6P3_9PEZI|nr:hypothetical protein LX32DRAFT_200511 [Colletotrichum zoysiae]
MAPSAGAESSLVWSTIPLVHETCTAGFRNEPPESANPRRRPFPVSLTIGTHSYPDGHSSSRLWCRSTTTSPAAEYLIRVQRNEMTKI